MQLVARQVDDYFWLYTTSRREGMIDVMFDALNSSRSFQVEATSDMHGCRIDRCPRSSSELDVARELCYETIIWIILTECIVVVKSYNIGINK